MSKLKVSAVSYLNTKPFLYGLFQSPIHEQLEIQLDIPSECARKLIAREVDFGLVPVVAIAKIPNPIILSNFCIGSDGPVRTVMIYSDVPMSEVKRLYLDFHSNTSVQLTQILLKEYWHLSPELLSSQEGYITDIQGDTAGLVIGDRAFDLAEKYAYQYDLSDIWKKLTGLPFVFAAWVSRKPLSKVFVQQFNEALQNGLDSIPQLISLMPSPTTDFDLKTYFEHQIQYDLDEEKKKALALFLKKVDENVAVVFQ